jgi:hypothetical protein
MMTWYDVSGRNLRVDVAILRKCEVRVLTLMHVQNVPAVIMNVTRRATCDEMTLTFTSRGILD